MLASATDAVENARPAQTAKPATADSASVAAIGRGMRTAAKRKPLASIQDNGQALSVPPAARTSLHTPAKPAGPVSAAAESPGLLRGFFAFLSPEQKRAAADAAAATMTQANDNTNMEAAAHTAIPLSESLDWASQDGAHAGATTTTALLPLSPPQLPSSKTIEKSPMATLLSAMKPVAAAAVSNAQPRSLASSFVPAAASAAAADSGFHANLHAVLQPYAALLPPEMLSSAPQRPAARKSDSALLSGAGAPSPALDMLCSSSASSPQPFYSSASVSSRFVCSECSKGFPSNSALSMHLLVHSDCKPFVCPAAGCSKAFRQKGHLISHHRKHTGVKPFICPAAECAKRFKDKSGLNTHVKRQHPTVSCAHVTAVAPSEEDAVMDPGLAAAIARANVMLAEMQNQGAAASADAMAAAAAASGSSTPLPHSGTAAPRSRTVPGSTTPKNMPSVAANAPLPTVPKQPAAAAKKRSHSSLGLAAAASAAAPSAASPSPSSLPLHLRRSLTPSLDPSLSSSMNGGDELELERLASSSALQLDTQQHSESSMQIASQTSGMDGMAATPSNSSMGSSGSASGDAQVHPLMKRSRSESPALSSHTHSHLPKLHLQSLSSSARSYSPIPSPILFFNPAATAAAATATSSQQTHANGGRSTPTSLSMHQPSSWMAQIPLPHASLAALYATPLMMQQQQHSASAATRSNVPSPSPSGHAHLPPPFGASSITHSPVFSSHDPQQHHGHGQMLPMMFNSAASSAFSFKPTPMTHHAAHAHAMQQQ